MKSYRARSIVPSSLQDYNKWPIPDLSKLDEKTRTRFERIRKAICMHIDGYECEKIRQETNTCRSEIRRNLKRCLSPGESNLIVGFYALLPYFRISRYRRGKPV